MTDDFDWKGAVFFVAEDGDTESMTIDSPEEAVAYEADAELQRRFDADGRDEIEQIRAWLDTEPEITIDGWRRKTIPQDEIVAAALRAAEYVDEWLGEENAGPDAPLFDTDEQHALAQAFTADITRVLRDVAVWACERAASRTYDADEIRAILLVEYPELAR